MNPKNTRETVHPGAQVQRQWKKGNEGEASRLFQHIIYSHYRLHARSFPWRDHITPYRVLVSEFMLQQTQTARVVEKFESFIAAFPDFQSLADASLHDVLRMWQGLGYNRRARALKEAAEAVVSHHDGALPSDERVLRGLPGIGPYTAAAICAFAFNKPVVMIETNIRTVFIHFFFPDEGKVTDAAIRPIVERTMDAAHPREWYYALMDYGVTLKQHHHNPGRRSAHHRRQSPFQGSDRQLRGMILKILVQHSSMEKAELVKALGASPSRFHRIISALEREGLVKQEGDVVRVA